MALKKNLTGLPEGAFTFTNGSSELCMKSPLPLIYCHMRKWWTRSPSSIHLSSLPSFLAQADCFEPQTKLCLFATTEMSRSSQPASASMSRASIFFPEDFQRTLDGEPNSITSLTHGEKQSKRNLILKFLTKAEI